MGEKSAETVEPSSLEKFSANEMQIDVSKWSSNGGISERGGSASETTHIDINHNWSEKIGGETNSFELVHSRPEVAESSARSNLGWISPVEPQV